MAFLMLVVYFIIVYLRPGEWVPGLIRFRWRRPVFELSGDHGGWLDEEFPWLELSVK